MGLDAGQAVCVAEQVWTQLPAEQSWPSAHAAPAVESAVLHAPEAPQ